MKKFVITFLWFLNGVCFCQNSFGQSKDEQRNYQHFTDSIISKIDNDQKNDSITFYRNEKGFRYMDNLDSLLRNLQKDRSAEIYKERKDNIDKSSDYSAINRFLSSRPVIIILWLLVILFLLFITYKFFYKINFFVKKGKAKSFLEDKPDEDRDASRLQKQLILQENAKMYNEAVRMLFLITLNKMSDKSLLHFSPDKTNRDYLMELKTPIINKEFDLLVRTFEYCWYGKFNISEERYTVIKNSFTEFNKKI